MKEFIKGLFMILGVFILLPILLPLFVLDMIMIIGGCDPLESSVRKLINKLC